MNVTSCLSARERIATLVDSNSFVEIGAMITKRSTDSNLLDDEIPGDGVITGYGLINSNPVYIYCQDGTAMGGTIGEMHAKKIAHIYDIALKVGAPVIGIIDSAGFRLQEATDALHGFGEIYQKKVFASGVIPQISVILGTCGGGLAVLTALSDFTFMARDKGSLFVNSPNALLHNDTSKLNTSTAIYNSEHGKIDFVLEDEKTVFEKVRELITIMPASNDDKPVLEETEDDLNRLVPSFSDNVNDIARAMKEISDYNYFLEVKESYVKEMVTGFIRLNGMTIGAIGNRLEENSEGKLTKYEDTLTTNGCIKAAEFVKFCDAFNIPILTFTNVSGYRATTNEEITLPEAVAKLTFGFTNATVPKVNVIVGKAFGSAYIAMNSKHIGADMVFAVDGTSIGMMDSISAAKIMYGKDPNSIDDKEKEYNTLQNSALSAAKKGYVDAIIEGASTRKHLIYAFDMLFTKRESRPGKKHGTI
jgi:acetyl-CoA carboxylase carboxyltransferase component